MQPPSDALKSGTSLPQSQRHGVPLAQVHLSHMLVPLQWATTIWALGQRQYSRYATFLAGGAPFDA